MTELVPDGENRRRLRAALVTNIPAPYRVPVFRVLAGTPGLDLQVVFCSGREADRQWDLPALDFDHVHLRERVIRWRGRFIHVNPDVAGVLRHFAPDVVVTTGFNPTHLLAFWAATRRGARHVAMTDGTLQSEAGLGSVHRFVRRRVYARSAAFVGASEGSMALYRSYGVEPTALFRSVLCADNDKFAALAVTEQQYDFIFCGRLAHGKLPLFAIEVAARAAFRLGRRARLLMVGSGPLAGAARDAARLAAGRVYCVFTGFAAQDELAAHYVQARLMLFPTLGDTWGVVANEACASGLPVLVSAQAGAAGELVRDGDNGRVLPLDADVWAAAAVAILEDRATWQRMSERSRALVAPYTRQDAAAGLAAALRYAAGRP